MGNCLQNCIKSNPNPSLTPENKEPFSAQKLTNENPHLSKDFKKIPFSRKNDSSFLYIADLKTIDTTIQKLENTEKLKESDAETLDNTLGQLDELKKKYNPFEAPTEGGTSNQASSEFIMDLGDKVEAPKKQEKGKTFVTYTSPLAALSRDIKDCVFTLEVQASEIISPSFLKNNELTKFFIKIRVFHADPGMNSPEMIKQSEVVDTFDTPRKSEFSEVWENMYQYKFETKDSIQRYYVGISFNFDQKNNSTHFELGEQYFSLSSLLDQKLQIKELDYKQPNQKSTIARILVRFQLVHDTNDVKERLFREVMTRIEVLRRMKNKGRTYSTGLMLTGSSPATSFFNTSDSKMAAGSYYEAGSIESSFIMK